jgi:hypothetical protein
MHDLNLQSPPMISNPLKLSLNKQILNPLQSNSSNIFINKNIQNNRYENVNELDNDKIKYNNYLNDQNAKNKKKEGELIESNSNNQKDQYMIDINKKKYNINNNNDNYINKSEKIDLYLEMKRESNIYKSKILENLNLNEKNPLVNIDNFEKNIRGLGLELSHIDPKLKKYPKLKIGKDVLLRKIKGRVREEKEMDFFRDNNLIGKIKNQNSNDFFGRFKPALSLGALPTQLPINLINSFEKRNDYEEERFLINREKLQLKKRKIHEINICKMQLENIPISINYKKLTSQELHNLNLYSSTNQNSNESLAELQKKLSKKIKKRKKNKLIMNKLTTYLIDFVEEIFCYQTERENTDITLKDWRNWTKMFILNEPFARAQKINEEYFDDNRSTEEEKMKQSNISKSIKSDSEDVEHYIKDTTYEECELLDYLNYKGRYNPNIISEKYLNKRLDFFEIMGSNFIPQSEINNNKNKNKKIKDYEPRDEDIENLTIPKEPQNNGLFSEIIEIVFDLKFNEDCSNGIGIKISIK